MVRQGILLAAMMTLGACGGSIGSMSLASLNPFAGSSRPAADTMDDATVSDAQQDAATQTIVNFEAPAPAAPYTQVPEVTRAWLDYSPRGVIVRADAVLPTLGFHSMRLHAPQGGRADANGDVHFEFYAIPPSSAPEGGTANARTVSAGAFIPNERLLTINSVTVSGAGNARTIRLR